MCGRSLCLPRLAQTAGIWSWGLIAGTVIGDVLGQMPAPSFLLFGINGYNVHVCFWTELQHFMVKTHVLGRYKNFNLVHLWLSYFRDVLDGGKGIRRYLVIS